MSTKVYFYYYFLNTLQKNWNLANILEMDYVLIHQEIIPSSYHPELLCTRVVWVLKEIIVTVYALFQTWWVSLARFENEQTGRKKQCSAFSKPSAMLMECSILAKDCDWLAESAIAIRLIKWNHGTPVQVLMKQPSKSWRKKSQERSQEAYCSSRNGKWVASASRLQDGVTQDAEVWPRSAGFAVQAHDLQRNVL